MGSVLDEIRDGGAAYGVSSGSCNHPRDGVAPHRNDPDDCASALPKKDSRADVQSESAEKLPKRSRSDRFSRGVNNESNHERLQGGQDRHVCKRNGLETDDAAYGCERFQQRAGDLGLRFLCAGNTREFEAGNVRKRRADGLWYGIASLRRTDNHAPHCKFALPT